MNGREQRIDHCERALYSRGNLAAALANERRSRALAPGHFSPAVNGVCKCVCVCVCVELERFSRLFERWREVKSDGWKNGRWFGACVIGQFRGLLAKLADCCRVLGVN